MPLTVSVDGRPWWKRRLMAIVLTVVELFLLVGRVVSDHCLACWLLNWFGLDNVAVAATAVQWLVVVALLASFAIAYYFGTQKWSRRARPAAFSCWSRSTWVFRAYLNTTEPTSCNLRNPGRRCPPAAMALLAALALLVGAEINCVRSSAAPHGKFSGQNA